MNLISCGLSSWGLFWLVLTLCLVYENASLAGDATYYRCVVDGTLEFRQTACPQGDDGKIHFTDHSRGITPSEPGLRFKQMTKKRKTQSSPGRKRDYRERCWKKRRQLERVERKLRAGYKASEYDGLHQRRAGYEDYIREFCR
jgi:hypothetical protein